MIYKTALLLVALLSGGRFAQAQLNRVDSVKKGEPIVMVGNSITYQGDWKKVLGRSDVLNWGIPGYTTEQIGWTIKHVISLQPKVCFMEGGINDLTLGISPERVLQNQIKVIDTFLAHHIIPVVQSTIYQNPSSDGNLRVKRVNQLLGDYCRAHQIDYLDLNIIFSANSLLKKELTVDGTHLKPQAYLLWAELIKKELTRLKL